jgi:hypothetical protein
MLILIAQLKLESNHIQNNNKYNIGQIKHSWHCRTRQMMRSVNDRPIKLRSVYSDQEAPRANRFTERNPLVWLYKIGLRSPGLSLNTPMHLMYD